VINNFLINGKKSNGLNPFDRGLAYGDGVFRTFLVKNKEPLNWALQFKKLQYDANKLNIKIPTQKILINDIKKLFPEKGSYVGKFIITRGVSERGYQIKKKPKESRILLKSRFNKISSTYYNKGVNLGLSNVPLSKHYSLDGIKHLNRLDNVIAKKNLGENFFDGIMFDDKGFVVECINSSIFARFGKKLFTSNHASGGVSGVTKEIVTSNASKLGLTIEYKNLTLKKLITADEIVITNSLYGALQVIKVATTTFDNNNLANKIKQLIDDER